MIAICIESSHQRGLGHLFRCMHLVRELERQKKAYIVLVNSDSRSENILYREKIEYEVVDLWDFQSNWELAVIRKYNVTVWLNDRMGTDYRHTVHVKTAEVRLCAIDDIGSGAPLCDINIIPIPIDDFLYGGKEVVCGVQYFVLNPQIAQFRYTRNSPNRIVVSLGGSDTYGVTVKVAKFLQALEIGADFVLGPAFSHEDSLHQVLQDDIRFHLLPKVPSLPALFYNYDIAITGGGGTPYEAAAAGLPCVIIANEPHEKRLAQFLVDVGCAVFTCIHEDLTCAFLKEALQKIKLPEMSLRGQQFFGFDGAQAVLCAVFDA